METHRKPEQYGDVALSVQASEFTYCTPRVTGLPLEDYSHVEIALIPRKDYPTPPKFTIDVEGFSKKERTGFFRPSDLGIEGFDDLFGEGDCPVAGYVEQERVEQLREHLREYAAKLGVK